MENVTTELFLVVFPLIIGLATWFLKSRTEELRAIEEQLRQQRVKIYKELLDPLIIAFSDLKGKGPLQAQKRILSREYKSTSFELVLLGGDDVIKAWNDLLQYGYVHEVDGGTLGRN